MLIYISRVLETLLSPLLSECLISKIYLYQYYKSISFNTTYKYQVSTYSITHILRTVQQKIEPKSMKHPALLICDIQQTSSHLSLKVWNKYSYENAVIGKPVIYSRSCRYI